MTAYDGGAHRFSWLHLTDLHVGVKDQDWMWPRLRDRLYQDLTTVHALTGHWDLVIFSGDLTQRGSREDFDKLDPILEGLWQHFRELGCTPKLIVQPGNHDLAWPVMSSQYLVLKQWWNNEIVREQFFATEDNEYRTAVANTFFEYDAWVDRFGKSHDFLLTGKAGLISGDQSLVLEKDGRRLGIVSLNSTWLQLDDDKYKGKLHVDVRQLLSVTANEPDEWLKQNDINLLVTHHPTNWLNQDSLELWNNEICPPGRFDAHLYGHMHEPSAWSAAFGGGDQRVSLQGASTCGLRYVSKSLERIHGYCAFEYGRDAQQRFLKAWPRKLSKLGDSSMRFNPDVSFPLDHNSSFTIALSGSDLADRSSSEFDEREVSLSALPKDSANDELLREITFPLPQASGHSSVRRVEQQRTIASLADGRACWLASEFGMGGDGYLASIAKQLPEQFDSVFRLDLSDYTTKAAFFESIMQQLKCTFERLCQLIFEVGGCVLVLDNVPSDSSSVKDVEEIVSVIVDYCPQLNVILRSRLAPTNARLAVVQLYALDKADLINYISDHELGEKSYISAEAINRIYTHTDGIPSRVDRALKELQVVSLADLVNSDAEVSSGAMSPDIPATLADAINRLADSEDTTTSRSFNLLKVLSLFPQGESLARLKYFYSAKPFFAPHAAELREQGLIDSVIVQRLDAAAEEPSPKILRVPRLARECVRERLRDEETFALNRRAAELYFGAEWSAGIYKPPPTYRFDKPLCNIADLGNANVIIIRLLRESAANEDYDLTERVLGLAVAHLAALSRGSHHQSACTFCDDILVAMVSGEHAEKIALIKHRFARSLRMCNQHDRAKEVIEEIRDFEFSSEEKQSLLVCLALIHQSSKEIDDAKQVSKEILKIDRNSYHGLQAQALLIEFDSDNPKQQEKLRNLEALCRRRDAIVVANNIALFRARRSGVDLAEAKDILAPLLKSKSSKEDFYNMSRAAIEVAERTLKQGASLSNVELRTLVAVYHFVYNEQFVGLFDRTHEALWKVFNANGDTTNLLSLFRHSSLHWRLRGMEASEKNYLKRLASVLGESISRRLTKLSVQAIYYLVRLNSLLTEAAKRPD